MFKKWKAEWLDRNEFKLAKEFEKDLNELKSSFTQTRQDWTKKCADLETESQVEYQKLLMSQEEILELSKRLDDRKVELARINEELRQQLRISEAKASPSNVWAEAFTCGFNKAWDMVIPIMSEGNERMKKLIEDKAITDTLRRMNGHNTKNY